MIKDGGGDARCKNGEQPAVPVSKKQEVLRFLHCGASNRTDRGAIRPYGSQNGIGVPEDFICHKTASSRYMYGLNTPLFLHTLHGSRICKKS